MAKKKKKSSGKKSKSGNNVNVVARFRPQNKRELKQKGKECIAIDEKGKSVIVDAPKIGKYNFNFDKIFNTECEQEDVFQFVGVPVVDDVFNGYNGTVFVYGQTGAGKTFSMMGPNVEGSGYCDDTTLKGLIPRIVERIFDKVAEADENIEFTIQVSYIEIYMEKIRDLFDPVRDNLSIKEDRESGKGIYVEGCSHEYVTSVEEVFRLMKQGAGNRVVSGHLQNAESSRSHSIFIITLNQKNLNDADVKSAMLFLVDLAGSEKVKKTGAAGQLLEEAKTINKSLSALGNVINALTDEKSKFVPYRDSKLTRLLQDSLGGNCRTTLLICCSPSTWNAEETLSTLRFGTRAKSIKNKAKVNREYTAKELKKLLDKTKKELKKFKTYAAGLEEELRSIKGGEVVIERGGEGEEEEEGEDGEEGEEGEKRNVSHVTQLQTRCEELEKEVDTLKTQLDDTMDKKEKLEDEYRDLKLNYENQSMELSKKDIEIAEKSNISEEYESLVNELEQSKLELDKVKYNHEDRLIEIEKLKSEKEQLNEEIQKMKEEEEKRLEEEKKKKEEMSATDAILKAYDLPPPDTPLTVDSVDDFPTPKSGLNDTLSPSPMDRAKSPLFNEPQLTNDNVASVNKELQELKEKNQEYLSTIKKLRREKGKVESIKKTLEQQKESLLQDLKNRCNKVIDLELRLDDEKDKFEYIYAICQQKEPQKRIYQLESDVREWASKYRSILERSNKMSDDHKHVERQLRTENETLQNKLLLKNARVEHLEETLDQNIKKGNLQQQKLIELKTKFKQREDELQAQVKRLNAYVSHLQQLKLSSAQESSQGVKHLRGGGRKRGMSGSGFSQPSSASTGNLNNRSPNPISKDKPSFSLTDMFFNKELTPPKDVQEKRNSRPPSRSKWASLVSPFRSTSQSEEYPTAILSPSPPTTTTNNSEEREEETPEIEDV